MSPEFSSGPENIALAELLDRTMQAEPEAINAVVDAITATLERLEVPEQKRFEVALAVQEALANAVKHGCDNDPTKQIRCRLKKDPQGRIVIIVTDPGPGFKPEQVADPKHGDNL